MKKTYPKSKIQKQAKITKPIYRFWGLAARLENKAIRIKGKRNK